MTVIDRFGRLKETPTGYVLQPGESLFSDLGSMHLPANTRRMGDAALAAFFRDGGMGGGKPDAVPAGFYRDSYGRVLATGRGPERDRVEGFRIARDAMLADAWKAGDDIGPANGRTNTDPVPLVPRIESEIPEAKKARKKYEEEMRNAWRQSDPSA